MLLVQVPEAKKKHRLEELLCMFKFAWEWTMWRLDNFCLKTIWNVNAMDCECDDYVWNSMLNEIFWAILLHVCNYTGRVKFFQFPKSYCPEEWKSILLHMLVWYYACFLSLMYFALLYFLHLWYLVFVVTFVNFSYMLMMLVFMKLVLYKVYTLVPSVKLVFNPYLRYYFW